MKTPDLTDLAESVQNARILIRIPGTDEFFVLRDSSSGIAIQTIVLFTTARNIDDRSRFRITIDDLRFIGATPDPDEFGPDVYCVPIVKLETGKTVLIGNPKAHEVEIAMVAFKSEQQATDFAESDAPEAICNRISGFYQTVELQFRRNLADDLATAFRRQLALSAKRVNKASFSVPEPAILESLPTGRQLLCDTVCGLAHVGLRLSRCAIVLPSPFEPRQWTTFSNAGYPEPTKFKNFRYRVGEGLTGSVLELNEVVHARDVERDDLFSRKWGPTIDRAPSEIGRFVFVGFPISVSLSGLEPFGVFAAMRTEFALRSGGINIPGPFLPWELNLLQLVSDHLSTLLTIYQDREDSALRAERTRLFSDSFSPFVAAREVSRRLATHVQQLLPVKRCLVAGVNPLFSQIDGLHSTTGFDDSIISDTSRRLFLSATLERSCLATEPLITPTKRTLIQPYLGEDVLAWVIRSGTKTPFVISADNMLVEQTTRLAHQVLGYLLIIPCHAANSVEGVVLCELLPGEFDERVCVSDPGLDVAFEQSNVLFSRTAVFFVDEKTTVSERGERNPIIPLIWLRERSRWPLLLEVVDMCREFAIFWRNESKRQVVDRRDSVRRSFFTSFLTNALDSPNGGKTYCEILTKELRVDSASIFRVDPSNAVMQVVGSDGMKAKPFALTAKSTIETVGGDEERTKAFSLPSFNHCVNWVFEHGVPRLTTHRVSDLPFAAQLKTSSASNECWLYCCPLTFGNTAAGVLAVSRIGNAFPSDDLKAIFATAGEFSSLFLTLHHNRRMITRLTDKRTAVSNIVGGIASLNKAARADDEDGHPLRIDEQFRTSLYNNLKELATILEVSFWGLLELAAEIENSTRVVGLVTLAFVRKDGKWKTLFQDGKPRTIDGGNRNWLESICHQLQRNDNLSGPLEPGTAFQGQMSSEALLGQNIGSLVAASGLKRPILLVQPFRGSELRDDKWYVFVAARDATSPGTAKAFSAADLSFTTQITALIRDGVLPALFEQERRKKAIAMRALGHDGCLKLINSAQEKLVQQLGYDVARKSEVSQYLDHFLAYFSTLQQLLNDEVVWLPSSREFSFSELKSGYFDIFQALNEAGASIAFDGNWDFNTSVDKDKLLCIGFAAISNSLKSIQLNESDTRRIRIVADRIAEEISLRFEDSGAGYFVAEQSEYSIGQRLIEGILGAAGARSVLRNLPGGGAVLDIKIRDVKTGERLFMRAKKNDTDFGR